jgi:hypothetical protein
VLYLLLESVLDLLIFERLFEEKVSFVCESLLVCLQLEYEARTNLLEDPSHFLEVPYLECLRIFLAHLLIHLVLLEVIEFSHQHATLFIGLLHRATVNNILRIEFADIAFSSLVENLNQLRVKVNQLIFIL